MNICINERNDMRKEDPLERTQHVQVSRTWNIDWGDWISIGDTLYNSEKIA